MTSAKSRRDGNGAVDDVGSLLGVFGENAARWLQFCLVPPRERDFGMAREQAGRHLSAVDRDEPVRRVNA
ncbi:MAG: hypothetical protein ABSA91_08105 [Acidimicrobiales bacterium]